MFKKTTIAAALTTTALAGFFSCSRKWDDHNQVQDPNTTINLYNEIAGNTTLSKFKSYLDLTGYADTLKLSQNYTVWAPTDAALQAVDAALNADKDKMKVFVAHHITRQKYFTTDVQATSKRLPMLDGKYVYFSSTKFDQAAITTADKFRANGVLHIISEAAAPVANVWNYVDTLKTTGQFNMASYLKAQEYDYFDSTKAIQTGVDADGRPVYQPGTGIIKRNRYIDRVATLNDESKEYTVFIVANTSWDAERTKLKPYYATSTTDSTNELTSWNTAKDLVMEGSYAPDQLPDSVTSKYGVKTVIKKSAIQFAIRTSNGYVYVMNEMNVALKAKLPQFVIQGENPSFYSNSVGNWIFYRTLVNPNTGKTFSDLFVYDHRINKFYVGYRISGVYTVKYKVYWVVANNNRFTNTFSQRLAIGTSTNTTFAYSTISPNVYDELYLGEYTVSSYGSGNLSLYLISADIAPTTSNQSSNSLFLDYVRLEPVIP
ncbi:MAG: fasciclin domain-containing protein [Chitinophagaceae bacterium]